ncbi:uncharacterized protein J7T54_006308 [Emericellopsis cladophorae]|uniref:Uncharacterized protein n=1 Tax=Emericellopsis cladophorae TaxID=2686198 RepID=A0A9P9YAF6_9HYPO|nr:uncharacterized protein J7T54_006308 [Emericellopsis cladophorae]KAI6785969.1 hypothetical protein J7T54_006308 [Emericellopsis cladophorae]
MDTDRRLTIILATVVPVTCVLILGLSVYFFARRRNAYLFKRGITPIADEEIETWKTDRNDKDDDDEKEMIPERRNPDTRHHQQNSSVSSAQKPASVIVYQNRMSSEQSPRSVGYQGHSSMDVPRTPVLARAPNARPGLTDDTIQGDDAFIPHLKRQPSRLSKSQMQTHMPRSTVPHHQRHRSAYSAIGPRDRWEGPTPADYFTRQSADLPRRGSAPRAPDRIYTATKNMPRMSFDEAGAPGGLSPRPPIHQSEIGRAIG